MITQHLQKPNTSAVAPKRGGTVAYPKQDPFAKTGNNEAPIQRQIVRGADVEENTINLTSTVTNFTDFGTTYVQLNGVEMPGAGGAFENAVTAPEFTVMQTGANAYTARVTGEAVNTISSRMTLPTAPEWETGIALNNLNVRINAMRGRPIQDAGFIGDKPNREVLLYVKGHPDDATIANLIRQHELHHVGDIDTAVNQALRPWDQAIQHAVAHNTAYQGDSADNARAAMWAGLGGTPLQVGTALRASFRQLGNAFHATPAGAALPLNRVEGRTRFLLRDIVRVVYG